MNLILNPGAMVNHMVRHAGLTQADAERASTAILNLAAPVQTGPAAWVGVHADGTSIYYDEYPHELTPEQQRQIHLSPLFHAGASRWIPVSQPPVGTKVIKGGTRYYVTVMAVVVDLRWGPNYRRVQYFPAVGETPACWALAEGPHQGMEIAAGSITHYQYLDPLP